MNCKEVQEKLYDLVFDLLDEDERRQVQEHVAHCAECSRDLAKANAEKGLLNHWEAPPPPQGLAARTMAAVRGQSARKEDRVMEPVAVEPSWNWFGSRRFWQAAAALVILVLSCTAAKTLLVTFRHADPAEAFLYGQTQLTPGLPAAFRVLVRDGRNQRPLARASVDLQLADARGHRIRLGHVQTDADGMANVEKVLPADLDEGNYTVEVNASSSAGEATVSQAVTVERSCRILVTTDKPLYQPGQTIHIRALALATANMRPAAAREMTIEVQDSKGNKVFKKRQATSNFGIASADFVLADQVNTGDYKIAATLDKDTSERSVTVERYVLPKFRIEMNADRGYYGPGETVTVDLFAEYTFGKPVAGATVAVTAEEFIEQFRPFATVKETTDESGRCRFSIRLKDFFAGQDLKKGDAIAKLKATVTDKAGHKQEKTLNLTVTKRPIHIELFPEGGELVRGVENVVYIVTAYPDGRPAKTHLTVQPTGQKVETSESGVATVAFTPFKDKLNVTVTATDSAGTTAQATRELNAGKRIDAFLLRTDRAIYGAGQTAHIDIVSAARRTRVFLDVVQDQRTRLMKTIPVEDGRGALALDLPEDLVGTLELHAYRILPDGAMVRDTRLIQVNRADALKISAAFDRETYRPGEKALLKFIVQRQSGDPTQAALSLAGVDEAVFALSDMQPGLEKVYFAIQKELLKPRYEIHAHAPITPEQAACEPAAATPDRQTAARVLFSATSGTAGPKATQGQTYNEKQAAVHAAGAQYFDRLMVAGLATPFVLFLLTSLPLFVYAFLLLARSPRLQVLPPENVELRPHLRAIMIWWLLGIYLPVLPFFTAALLYGDDAAFFRAIGAGIALMLVTLAFLTSSVRNLRQCTAMQSHPLLGKIAVCLPLLSGFIWLTLAASIIGSAKDYIHGGTTVLFALGAQIVLAAFVTGAWSVAAHGATSSMSKSRWFYLFLTRTMCVLVPALVAGALLTWYELNRGHFSGLALTILSIPSILLVATSMPIVLYAIRQSRELPQSWNVDVKGAQEVRSHLRAITASWLTGTGLLFVFVAMKLCVHDDRLLDAEMLVFGIGFPFGMPLVIGLLALHVRRLLRHPAIQRFGPPRKVLLCLPIVLGLGWVADGFLMGAPRLVGYYSYDPLVFAGLVLVLTMAVVTGAWSVSAHLAIRPLSRRRKYYLFLSRPLYVLLPLAIFLFSPLVEPWKGKLFLSYKTFGNPAARLEMAPMCCSVVNLSRAPTVPRPQCATPAVRVRQFFPETLFWRPELITDEKGRAQIEIDLADSITTWRVAMSAVSPLGELGADSRGLRVFQDFFVDVDFPVSLTQNDLVSVPIAVFNYLDKPQTVKLAAQRETWCEFLDGTERQIEIAAKDVASTYLRVRATRPGRHALTVKANGFFLADAVRREVTVTPDGQRVEQVLNGSLRENLVQEVSIPPEAIEGANDLFVKIYPGSFSQVMEGLDGILQMPSGCFEQTSSSTYPNVLVLDYLRRTKQIKPDIEMKAAGYINTGYQRLLSYEVKGGGFEWFGRAPAHTILTAYGLMEFHDMAAVYEIDPAVIARTREWLFAQQSTGAWKASAGGIAEGAINQFQGNDALRTTAYIAWALAESGDTSDYRLQGALGFIADKSGGEKDPYTLALCANALIAAGQAGKASDILSALDQAKKQEEKLVHWSSAAEGVTYSRGDALDVETTALAAYAMLKAQRHTSTALQALAWLVAQKDSAGTWRSTQATIHAMRALLAGTGSAGGVESDLRTTIACNGKAAEEVTITPDTSDVFRLISLRDKVQAGKNRIAIETSGKGDMAYQIVARHYMPWPGKSSEPVAREPLEIALDYDTTTVQKDDMLTCRVTVRYNRPGIAQMTIVDLGIPPGFDVVTDAFDALKQKGGIERYSVAGRQVILYFREIRNGQPVTFDYRLKAKYPVRAKTPVSTAYQYYEPEIRAQAKPVLLTVN